MTTPEPVPLSVLPSTFRVTTDGSSLAAIWATDLGFLSTGVGAPEASGGPEDRSEGDFFTWPCSYATPEIAPIAPPMRAAISATTSSADQPSGLRSRAGYPSPGGITGAPKDGPPFGYGAGGM